MERKFVMILILGFGFMFVFTAFQTICNIEVSPRKHRPCHGCVCVCLYVCVCVGVVDIPVPCCLLPFGYFRPCPCQQTLQQPWHTQSLSSFVVVVVVLVSLLPFPPTRSHIHQTRYMHTYIHMCMYVLVLLANKESRSFVQLPIE